jgi:hypothetical protein
VKSAFEPGWAVRLRVGGRQLDTGARHNGYMRHAE